MGPLVAISLPGGKPQDHQLAHGIGQNAMEAQMLAQRAHLRR